MNCFFFFKNDPSVPAILEECNDVFFEDFGPGFELGPNDAPDLLAICRNPRGRVVGVLTLHLTAETRAWELGTMSARDDYSHRILFLEFMEHVPSVLLGTMQNDVAASYIVKRVKQDKKLYIQMLEGMGFERPVHFLIGIMSDEGYIPFDPFDEVLLKMKLCPPLLEQRNAPSSVVLST